MSYRLRANLFFVTLLFLISTSPGVMALDVPANGNVLIQLPEGHILQKTVYSKEEFAKLNNSSVEYQLIHNGNLITFGPSLDLISSEKLNQVSTAWAMQADGSLIGMTGCVNLAFGLDECKYISDLKTGKILFAAQSDNLFDPHELKIDDRGNFWFLSYPKIDCLITTSICASFKINPTKFFADCQINAMNSDGQTVFRWKASQHIPSAEVYPAYIKEGPRGKYVDLFHCNSIDFVDSQRILLSFRNTNSIYLLNTASSEIEWKLGGHYLKGVSLLTSGFKRGVGNESIAQHDARSLGNGFFSYFDNASHTSKPARGVIFKVSGSTHHRRATMVREFLNPNGINSLCAGSTRAADLGNTVVGWGCSLNAITIFNHSGRPIVSLDIIETSETSHLFSHLPLMLQGEDWGPAFTYLMSYRVTPVIHLR